MVCLKVIYSMSGALRSAGHAKCNRLTSSPGPRMAVMLEYVECRQDFHFLLCALAPVLSIDAR